MRPLTYTNWKSGCDY